MVNDITEYRRIPGGSRQQRNRGFMEMQKMQELPSDARDTKVWHAGQTAHMTGWRRKRVPHSVPNPSTFQAFLKTKTEYKWMFKHTRREMPFVKLATAIRDGAAIEISDGPHKNYWGMASWRLMSSTADNRQWRGLHITPGQKGDHSTFRSELGGIYAMLVAITLLCECFDIDQ
jgi:hypothetical protein